MKKRITLTLIIVALADIFLYMQCKLSLFYSSMVDKTYDTNYSLMITLWNIIFFILLGILLMILFYIEQKGKSIKENLAEYIIVSVNALYFAASPAAIALYYGNYFDPYPLWIFKRPDIPTFYGCLLLGAETTLFIIRIIEGKKTAKE